MGSRNCSVTSCPASHLARVCVEPLARWAGRGGGAFLGFFVIRLVSLRAHLHSASAVENRAKRGGGGGIEAASYTTVRTRYIDIYTPVVSF